MLPKYLNYLPQFKFRNNKNKLKNTYLNIEFLNSNNLDKFYKLEYFFNSPSYFEFRFIIKNICGQIDYNKYDDLIQLQGPPQQFDCTYHKEKFEIKPNETVKALKITLNEYNILNFKTNEQNMQQIQQIKFGPKVAKVCRIGCKRVIDWCKMLPLKEDEFNEVLGILDKSFCDYLVYLENVQNQRTTFYESQLKNEIEKKFKNKRQS
ncbi:unnamed protein product [Paramecium primaurelia]|uniref:Uncharacterized protein n=1 Tax=Paramecium primaurelia TaxID=5886 RepID=A0A8S1QHH3_PARPR|nr:unnamed protein product [Paramecium primaurelia]